MKKGFTLVELITVLIILAVIGLIVFPTVNSTIKESKEKAYIEQLEEIKLASEKWAYKNLDMVPNNNGDSVTITLLDLKKSGFLPLDVRNPKTNELFSNALSVTITLNNNKYEYTINDTSSDTEYNEFSPILVLNGEYIEYVEINSEYIEKGAKAKKYTGEVLDNIEIQYLQDGKEIASIPVYLLGTYNVTYTVSDNEYTSELTRTVIVRDTIPPTLILPTKVTISQSEALNYDLLKDIEYSDNSNGEVKINITGFDNTIGEKIVTYEACDLSNNCVTKNRIIEVK